MPPPVPPSVKLGRMIAGRPMSSSASSACDQRLDLVRARRLQPDLGHRLAEQLAVLRLVDGVGGGADHLDAEFLQHAHLAQGQRAVERGLPAHGGQQRVRALLLDDLGDDLRRDRLDVSGVGEIGVGHDRRRIGIDQDDPVALGLQRLAGLRAGIVEFAGLADDDRAGADDQDRFDVGSFGHCARWTMGTKKGRAFPRVPSDRAEALGTPRARGALDQNSTGREGRRDAISGGRKCADKARPSPRLRRAAFALEWLASRSVAKREDWRPGLDSNQAGRPCTASASPLRHRAGDRLISARPCRAVTGGRPLLPRAAIAVNARFTPRAATAACSGPFWPATGSLAGSGTLGIVFSAFARSPGLSAAAEIVGALRRIGADHQQIGAGPTAADAPVPAGSTATSPAASSTTSPRSPPSRTLRRAARDAERLMDHRMIMRERIDAVAPLPVAPAVLLRTAAPSSPAGSAPSCDRRS